MLPLPQLCRRAAGHEKSSANCGALLWQYLLCAFLAHQEVGDLILYDFAGEGVGERGVEKGIAIVHVYFQQGFLTVYAVEEKT